MSAQVGLIRSRARLQAGPGKADSPGRRAPGGEANLFRLRRSERRWCTDHRGLAIPRRHAPTSPPSAARVAATRSAPGWRVIRRFVALPARGRRRCTAPTWFMAATEAAPTARLSAPVSTTTWAADSELTAAPLWESERLSGGEIGHARCIIPLEGADGHARHPIPGFRRAATTPSGSGARVRCHARGSRAAGGAWMRRRRRG